MTGETKSSAVSLGADSKNAVVITGFTKTGAGWLYDDLNLTYDGATDPEGRAVTYEAIGEAPIMTPLTKNSA